MASWLACCCAHAPHAGQGNAGSGACREGICDWAEMGSQGRGGEKELETGGEGELWRVKSCLFLLEEVEGETIIKQFH